MNETVYKHSAGGVVLNDGKVLVISSEIRGSTSLPKGKLDEGESPESAAIREVKEETGYDVEIVKKLGDQTYEFDKNDTHIVKTVTYYSMCLANDLPPQQNLQDGEDFEVKWVDVAEAPQLFSFDDARDALAIALS